MDLPAPPAAETGILATFRRIRNIGLGMGERFSMSAWNHRKSLRHLRKFLTCAAESPMISPQG